MTERSSLYKQLCYALSFQHTYVNCSYTWLLQPIIVRAVLFTSVPSFLCVNSSFAHVTAHLARFGDVDMHMCHRVFSQVSKAYAVVPTPGLSHSYRTYSPQTRETGSKLIALLLSRRRGNDARVVSCCWQLPSRRPRTPEQF